MKKINNIEFDFDQWADLAKNDPGAFEKQRLDAIEQLIDSAPSKLQPRLHGLQWQINQQRTLAKTPMAACIKISQMMWQKMHGKNGLLDNLKALQGKQSTDLTERFNKTSSGSIHSLCEIREAKAQR